MLRFRRPVFRHAFFRDRDHQLKTAASRSGVELLVLDNHYDPEIAVRNADRSCKDMSTW